MMKKEIELLNNNPSFREFLVVRDLVSARVGYNKKLDLGFVKMLGKIRFFKRKKNQEHER